MFSFHSFREKFRNKYHYSILCFTIYFFYIITIIFLIFFSLFLSLIIALNLIIFPLQSNLTISKFLLLIKNYAFVYLRVSFIFFFFLLMPASLTRCFNYTAIFIVCLNAIYSHPLLYYMYIYIIYVYVWMCPPNMHTRTFNIIFLRNQFKGEIYI